MNARRSGLRRVLVIGAVLGAVSLPLMPATAVAPVATQAAAAPADGYSKSKTVERAVLGTDGQPDATYSSSYDMTVTADRTTELRGRERIDIAWSGARPSGGRASNPFGENGLLQEYPVVVMQCRGIDDPSLPAAKQLRPETCWTSSVQQRSQRQSPKSEALWRVDRYQAPADREPVSGMTPFPSADCPGMDSTFTNTHLTEFVDPSGKVYPACSSSKMPPEAGIDAAFPPSEVAAFTDLDGKGSVQFEVRSTVENESLGCSDKVACSIVVIPILGISCDTPSSPRTVMDRECRTNGLTKPGSSNFAKEGVSQAVSPALWWSESNWRNRFTIPISFGLPAGVCDILDSRAPTSFYGSELMAQAALQWAPAYCLRKDRFKFELSQMPDDAGWKNMESGTGPAAFVSSEHQRTGTDPVGYAPTAVTGFAIGYAMDRPGNAGEYDDLRLNPRLIAKLLSQSYLGSDLGRAHPGIEGNPLAIMADPEFIDLNPNLSRTVQEVGATLLSLSVSSDLVRQLTSYLAQNEDAMDFIGGKPDPWGMKVNPAYQGLELPRDEWPLLDTYIPKTENKCLQQNPSVYFSQVASPVSTLRTIADALIDAWPNVQTRCDYDTATATYKLGRRDRQDYGTRFMLGLISLGDADRYGLRPAALQTSGGNYVLPTEKSMSAAVSLMRQPKTHEPFAVSQQDLIAAKKAYPGTMVVYTGARLQNLDKAQAREVASFVRIATSEGQVRGRGNGNLPAGYVPIRKTGATAALWRAAQKTASAIAAQKVPVVKPPKAAAVPNAAPVVPPAAVAPAVVPPVAAAPKPGTTTAETVPTAATPATDSAAGGMLLPALILVGGLAIASSIVSRVVGARGGRT